MKGIGLAIVAVFVWELSSPPSFLQQIDKEDETGQYQPVLNWPQPWSQDGYIWGSAAGVFAESPDRVFLAIRGELKVPDPKPRGFLGFWGSLGQLATDPRPEMRNCIVVLDRTGKAIEKWTQWDHLFVAPPGAGGIASPHKIKINPYDPERSVWVVDDVRHAIYKFTNDGKQLVMTLGEPGVAANDDKHFGRPQDVAWLPDGSLLVADGLTNSRVAKFDKNGKFVTSWGTKGTGPGQLSGPHGIETDAKGNVYVADRGNRRIQVFDKDGKYIKEWNGLRQINDVYIGGDQQVWAVDGVNSRLLKMDQSGAVLYWWGTHDTYPGALWEPHQVSVDSEGNLYIADSYNGRALKYSPKPGADRAKLMSPPANPAVRVAR